MKQRIIILFMVILTIIGAILATEALLDYLSSEPKSLSAEVDANFPRMNYWGLFVTEDSGGYMQLIETPQQIYTTAILFEDGRYVYKWTDGTWTTLPTNTPLEIPWAFVDGEIIYATIFVDEYGVWIDLRLFDQSSDI